MNEVIAKTERDPLVALCNILHTFGPGSKEVEAFKVRFSDDQTFQRRAVVLEKLVNERDEVSNDLGEGDSMPPTV